MLSQSAALLLVASALLAWPRSLASIRLHRAMAGAVERVPVAELADLARGQGRASADAGSVRELARPGAQRSALSRSRWLSRAMLSAALVALAQVWSWPLALVVIAVGTTLGRGLLRARDERADARAEQAAVEGLGVLVAELRAGRSGGEALAAAGRHCGHPLVGEELSRLGRSVQLGDRLAGDPDPARASSVGDAARSFRARVPAIASLAGRSAGRGRTRSDWQRRLIDGLRLSRVSGCALADVVAAVESDLAKRGQQRADLRAAAAGHRATVALLAGLPLLGLAMGSGIGAEPVHVLTATPLGNILLLAGVGLELAGLAWSRRITSAAMRDG